MFGRLKTLYLRYAAMHSDRLGGFSLPRVAGRPTGHVERVICRRGEIVLSGWANAVAIAVAWPGGTTTVCPDRPRPDVTQRLGLAADTGFEVSVPDTGDALSFRVELVTGRVVSVAVPHPDDPPSARARQRLLRAFLRDLLRATPHGLRWLVHRDEVHRARIKRALGLEAVRKGLPIDERFLGDGAGAPNRATGPVTIILPVFDAYDMVAECLDRIDRNTDLPWHLVAVEDASTDPRILPLLREWAADHAGRITLIENATNLGFVGAVNRAFDTARDRPGPVILLNTDAMVPPGWASRLCGPFQDDPSIASVTPMSNDAEIFSVPLIAEAARLQPGQGDRLDRAAQGLSHPAPLPSAPTGVGFCMALARPWFDRLPRFDPAFGRGYGEEVDWCQKTRRMGARHVALPTLFVEHKGGQSFGTKAKSHLVARANAMIARRYPTYDLEVQTYIGQDPLRTARLALAIALAGLGAARRLPLFIAHSLGGGAEHALAREIAQETDAGRMALVLRVGGDDRWQVEVHGPRGVVSGRCGALAPLHRMLSTVPALRVVYSCGVGDCDPATLPEAILSLMRDGRDDRLEVRVHDYFMISPSYCLLDRNGQYRGLSRAALADPAHATRRPDGRLVSLRNWQMAWHRLLTRSAEITVFSDSSRAVIEAVYPTVRARIRLRPHGMLAAVPQLRVPASAAPVLGVLGNVNRQKGADVLITLAERLAARGGARLVLIGNCDPRYAVPRGVTVHGGYLQSEIGPIARRHGITTWISPAIWPETFSFATHEMLATGLPVIGFDLGAQGAALRAAPNGVTLPFSPGADLAGAILDAIGALAPATPADPAPSVDAPSWQPAVVK